MFFNQEKIDTMNKNLLYISLFAAAMTSCSDKDSMYDDGTLPENNVSVEIEDFVFEDGTRANYTKQDDRFVFSWEKGDELGVFADKGGHQALFKVAAGEGSNTALIEGGDWKYVKERNKLNKPIIKIWNVLLIDLKLFFII